MQMRVRNARSAPLHAASGMFMIGVDWLIFAANLLHGMRDTLAISVAGAALCGGLVLWVEHTRGDAASWRLSGQKALVAGLAVAMPLAVVGSLLGAIAVAWALMVAPPAAKPRKRGPGPRLDLS
jgi:hypothetical protein